MIQVTGDIPPCDIPSRLPTVTTADVDAKERTVIVKEDLVRVQEILQLCEPVSSESDWSDGNNNVLQYEDVSEELEYEDISEESEYEAISDTSFQEVQEEIKPPDTRDSPCPISTCSYLGRKLKFHVQQMHLPRVMWDNPQPPVKDEKINEWNHQRADVLRYLSECLTESRNVWDLARWTRGQLRHLIPRYSQILPRGRIQMENLCDTMRWHKPSRYRLVPVYSPCILIHWRWQVRLS